MSVTDALLRQPRQFDFIQVIRLLRQLAKTRDIRLFAEPMPEGASCEVRAIEQLGSQTQIRLGLEALSGVKGVLPDYLYEELLAGLHAENGALDDFLGIFNHRYYQLLQGTLEKGNLLLRDERERLEAGSVSANSQRHCLAQLAALPGVTEERSELLRYSVLLGLKTRSLAGLRQLLRDYFKLQIHVNAIFQSRYRLPDSSLTRLGGEQSQNNRLGRGLLLGQSGLLHAHRLEIRVEPRDQREFLRLQADRLFAGRLQELAQAYLSETTDLKFYLYVKRALISAPILSSRSGKGVRLGEANCLAPQSRSEEFHKILLQQGK
ncbi:MAG: type VI secretion system baseplate subunit TssG [Halopseudomonas sp.]